MPDGAAMEAELRPNLPPCRFARPALRPLRRSVVQNGEALEQPMHIFERSFAVREQDAVADRRDQNVDCFLNREPGLATVESAAIEGLQMVGRVSATARGGGVGF